MQNYREHSHSRKPETPRRTSHGGEAEADFQRSEVSGAKKETEARGGGHRQASHPREVRGDKEQPGRNGEHPPSERTLAECGVGIGYLCFYGEGREECVIQALSPDGKFAKLHSRQTGKGFENVPVEDLEIDWKTINKLNEMRRKNGGTLLVPFVPKSQPPPGEKKERKSARSKAKERWKLLNDWNDFTMRELGKTETKVWITLWREAKGGVTVISQRVLADRCGCTQSSVSRAIKVMVKMGLIDVVRQGKYLGESRSGIPSKYRLWALKKER